VTERAGMSTLRDRRVKIDNPDSSVHGHAAPGLIPRN
jgi:hypothetical protein